MFELKKLLLIFAAAALSLSMAACGDKTTEPPVSDQSAQETETAAPENFAENTAEDVDMDKVSGEKLDDTSAEDDSLEDSGEIDSFNISIEDAKVIDYDEKKVFVVSYKFKNNTSSPVMFTGVMETEVTQSGMDLPSAVVTGVEGINTSSAMESVEPNDTITVQETYLLRDEQTDINVAVHKYGEPAGASVSKAFKLQ